MFRRILIPTDFSSASEWVFDDAVNIAGSSGAELLIVHVRRTWASSPDQLRFPADSSLYDYVEQQELERLRERVRRANASVTTRLIVRKASDVGEEIGRAAADEKADLIVIATHARHHVAHLLVGSTTMIVIEKPPAPVLAIRYGIRKRESIQRIVVPVHLQQTSHAALELAVRAAQELHLIMVCKDDESAKAETHLRELAARFSGPTIKTSVLRGSDIEKEVVRYADKQNADAIFLNAGGQLSEGKLDIIRNAPVPVMIVP
ncbi:MAG TPA: universal stress protein [Thermoanaerobaculia bacterium]|nr:universal stress protein [Thermoanaerobaculia bacterium]